MTNRWTFIAMLILLMGASPVKAQEVPAQPPPDTAIRWDVHRSLGIILVFQVDEGELLFAHPIVMSQAVPECQGIKLEATGDLLRITETNTSHVPMRHIVMREPTVWRWEWGDWHAMIEPSFQPEP